MTPRTEVVGLPVDLSIQDAADQVAESGRSRYPVYRESLDDIVGIVHAKEILGALRQRGSESVSTLMRQPIFLPGTREVEDVLADMQRLKAQMAVGDPDKYPDFAGNVKSFDTRSMGGGGYHYNNDGATYTRVGDAMGRAMVELLNGQAEKNGP